MDNSRVGFWLSALLLIGSCRAVFSAETIDQRIDFSAEQTYPLELNAGDTFQISVGVESPSKLPANGRVLIEWTGPTEKLGFRKVLHALDPDVYLVYRAPVPGRYTLTLRPLEVDDDPKPDVPRWRESGSLLETRAFPSSTPWPVGHAVPMRVLLQPTDFGEATQRLFVEAEPNNSIEQAQPIPLAVGNDDQIVSITGGADDIEYFDNTQYGESGDDWFRIEFQGTGPRMLSVNMMPTDHFVTGRVRVYSPDGTEYVEGKHLNETAHDQVEEHRTAVVRTVKPGGVYFLRVEANSPGYDLDVRIRRPAPFTDPREAVRLAMYDHVAQVSAWLMNRPRGNSLDRRQRDTGTMYGSNCMSCHTQSGVWGPAGPVAYGYRIENPLHYRHLVNVMYESLRPTNVLKDAANNTSLPPHDLGDGPAGTRVAGHNVVMAETVIEPRKLHSKQQIRTANYILQTNDPSGINAAGKGSNVGQSVVIQYSSEILRRAWDSTGDVKYLDGIEVRATKMLEVQPKFTDDIAHRIMFFRRVFPANFATLKGNSPAALALMDRAAKQVEQDEQTLRSLQREDGAWGFAPAKIDATADPAPTALAIDALISLGAGPNDPAIAKAVPALLAMQHPFGLWNRSARTGFVTTAYVLNTLSRLYPDSKDVFRRADFEAKGDESTSDTIARMRRLAHLDRWSSVSVEDSQVQLIDLMQSGARHTNPAVRYWAMIALGARHSEVAMPTLVGGLGDSVKMVREAARWGLRQTLIDDQGWDNLYAAYDRGGDLEREQIAATLVMRVDAVKPESRVDFQRLAELLDRMMSDDRSPAVRAWAPRAAWNWWLWNPPIRSQLNEAYLKMLQTPEPCQLAENAKRYQLQALFIVNGNRASANYDNPYRELSELFKVIGSKLDQSPQSTLLSQRLVGAAATYYNSSYGSNGTGQLGYATPNSADAIGKAIESYWERAELNQDLKSTQLAIEASANVVHEGVQKKLLHYAVHGSESLRTIASTSLSDPRAVVLPTSAEFVGPLMERVLIDAQSADGRRRATRNTMRQISQARWDIPAAESRQREFFGMMIPKLDNPKDDTQWFLAEQLGRAIAANPDFRTETFLSMMPETFASPLEEMFWLPNTGWMLTYDAPVPEIGQPVIAANRAELRQFALDLYLKHLSPEADSRLRAVAISMLYQPALNTNPKVAAAAAKVESGDFKMTLPEAFAAEIHKAAAQDMSEVKLELTPDRVRNFAYFRDYVVPEMGLENRRDGNSCFSCHGGGKVPSMPLEAPERRTKYLSPTETWMNYRTMLDRIDFSDVEQSKVLRKPLNIQTGKEDGHQGDMRYKPTDRGYEILKRWVYDAARLKAPTLPN